MQTFIEQVRDAGCDTFIVHARKAWLSGLSPEREPRIPPLDYPRVYRVKQDYPDLTIAINGGVTSLEQSLEHMQHLDGVMMGREAYQNPTSWPRSTTGSSAWRARCRAATRWCG